MVKLEMIFSRFVSLSKQMLFDHLEGALSNPSDSLLHESKFVPSTNAAAERDFGMLDRLMRMKPKALDLVYEGIIMFNLNKTKEWRDSLSPSNLSIVMRKARESKGLQKKLFFNRKKEIHEARVEKLRRDSEEKERKARNLTATK